MKRLFVLIPAIALAGRPGWPQSPHPAGPIRKAAVMVISTDSQIVRDAEFEIRSQLAGRQVDSLSFSALYPSGTVPPSAELRRRLAEQGCDAILILHRSGHIGSATSEIKSLDKFLEATHAASPTAQDSIVLEPLGSSNSVESRTGMPGSQPIPGSQTASGTVVLKIGASVFDIPSAKLRWQKNVAVKIAYHQPTAQTLKQIAKRCAEELYEASLVGPH